MSATYDPNLPSNKDHVRRLIGDVNTANAMLSDEEILAIIAEEASNGVTDPALKYIAAAHALEDLHLTWMSRGRGVASKKVSQLSLVFATGSGVNIDMAIQEKIKQLKMRGNALLTAIFKMT